MLTRLLPVLATLSCQGDPPAAQVASQAIEVTSGGKSIAKVVPGRPCRATVDGIEVIVGAQPFTATIGDAKWTAVTDTNGTTFKNNDQAVARIHANQLFDAQGIPLVRATDAGDISNGPGRLVRKATVIPGYTPQVEIKSLGSGDSFIVTHTEDVVLAALLSAPEADPTIRALVACHFLQAAGS